MRLCLVLFLLFFTAPLFAERIVVYDSTTSAVQSSFSADPTVTIVTGPLKVLSFSEFDSNLTTILNLLNRSIVLKHWIIQADTVAEMTQTQKDSVDLCIAVADTANTRTNAKNVFEGFSSDPLYERAKIEILIREINLLRKWTRDFKTETAASTSLADFKTRVATLPTLADRTLAQFKTNVKNEIDSGNVDTAMLLLPLGVILLWLKKRHR